MGVLNKLCVCVIVEIKITHIKGQSLHVVQFLLHLLKFTFQTRKQKGKHMRTINKITIKSQICVTDPNWFLKVYILSDTLKPNAGKQQKPAGPFSM